MKKALVIGVGPLNGLGGQLCRKIANNNFEVFVAGRTRSSLDNVVNNILNDGNRAIPIVCLLYTSPSPRDPKTSRMPSSA